MALEWKGWKGYFATNAWGKIFLPLPLLSYLKENSFEKKCFLASELNKLEKVVRAAYNTKESHKHTSAHSTASTWTSYLLMCNILSAYKSIHHHGVKLLSTRDLTEQRKLNTLILLNISIIFRHCKPKRTAIGASIQALSTSLVIRLKIIHCHAGHKTLCQNRGN